MPMQPLLEMSLDVLKAVRSAKIPIGAQGEQTPFLLWGGSQQGLVGDHSNI